VTVFGDYEPEDAWHPEDPPAEQVRNLRLRLALLFSDPPDEEDLRDELDVILAALTIARRRRLNDRNLLRADDLETDAHYVLGRLP
jgi:hypothetical protein